MSGFFGGGGRPNPQPPGRGYDDRVPPGSAYGGPNHGDDRYRQAPQQDYGGYSDEKYRQGGLPPGPRMSGGSGGGGMPRPSPQGQVQRRPPPADSQVWQLEVVKSPSDDFTYRNLAAVSPQDFPDRAGTYIILNDLYVLTVRPIEGFQRGAISLAEPQRSWASVSIRDVVQARRFDPFSGNAPSYVVSMDVEISFASQKKTSDQLDQDNLGATFTRNYENQIIAPNQRLIMEYKGVKLLFVVKTVQLGDLSMSTSGDPETLTLPTARGILTQSSQILLFKDAKSNINLKPSKKRPVTNAILQPNFKFEEMGIGGLDKEFGTIFRRAFASRIFPPGLIQSIGVQHVKGILLFGPPGTGKTLIARQIGKMLNAREPKIINGPEVLNKYVGQSEENIRKLFADAEKEYKEKGEESGLHIIIFDELDAVCKQRGSGAGGGTGVGDSVVNQLLAKLDGVDQLNNILLIGMTNRKDMIDDALMRPGRLEVHMEISLPDEAGRIQILKIHTTKMSESGNMDPDVNILNIAKVTKNFSGAEISGLVRSATSFALNRYVKDGTTAGIRDDVQDLKVNSHDFNNALQEVKSAFGVSEDDLMRCIPNGIIHYSPFIDNILKQGHLRVQQVRDEQGSPLYSALLYGLQDSGKTALAAEIALSSGFPFIQLCSPINMIGLNEPAKVSYIQKIFEDAYKSPLSIVIIDDIERILNWSSVGPRFENNVCQTLLVLLKKTPPEGKRLLILGTSSDRGVLNRLDLFRAFKTRIAVPNVGTIAELAHIMQDSKAFSDPRGALEQLHEITKSDRINVGIKQVLEEIKGAKQNKDINGTFASEMANLVAENKDLESEEESKEESKE